MATYTTNLQLSASDWQSPNGVHYHERYDEDQRNLSSLQTIDAFAGHVTASCQTDFFLSGNIATQLSTPIGTAFSTDTRVITNVAAWARTSGSGGVTTIDLQLQGPAGNFVSAYSNNALRPAISSSLGDYGVASGSSFTSGSAAMPWAKNKLMKVVATTAAGEATAVNAMFDVSVSVFWKPTGSYGA